MLSEGNKKNKNKNKKNKNKKQNFYLLNSKSPELSPDKIEHIWTEGQIEYNLTRNSVSVCVLKQV